MKAPDVHPALCPCDYCEGRYPQAAVAELTALRERAERAERERDNALTQSYESSERARRAELLATVTTAEHPDKAALAAETIHHMHRAEALQAQLDAALTENALLRERLLAWTTRATEWRQVATRAVDALDEATR